MSRDTFDIIFLIARPAAGKSEIIDYLKRSRRPNPPRSVSHRPFRRAG